MSIPVATRNKAADIPVTHLSLHNAWPGAIGANEISGGAYARKVVTFAAPSGGLKATASAVTFDVPPTPVAWVGMWDGPTFRGAMPNGGASSKNFVASPQLNLFVAAAHGYAAGQALTLFDGTAPGGFIEGAVYYVVSPSADTFKLSATVGGAAIDITEGSSFGCVVAAIEVKVFASTGTHQVVAVTIAVPD